MTPITYANGPITYHTEGGDPDWPVRFRAELCQQLDEGGTLFGYDEAGAYWAVTAQDRRRVVPGTGGRVPAPDA